MNITGVERFVFGVDDLAESRRFLTAYGLSERESGQTGATFDALDGSGVELRMTGDDVLPAANVNGPTMRAAVWGVKTKEDLDAIADELSKDRQIAWVDGRLQSTDDDNNAVWFQVSERRPYESDQVHLNVAGHAPARFNTRVRFDGHGPARQLGHVVYWSPDPARSMAFYRDRLGFRVTDAFAGNRGIFGRAKEHSDHHSLFFINNPNIPPSFQHGEFTFGDVQDVFAGGHRLNKQGFQTAFGPGRFELGSNWYWYIKTPMGGAFELGADMDQIDDDWRAGEFEGNSAAGWVLQFDFERARP